MYGGRAITKKNRSRDRKEVSERTKSIHAFFAGSIGKATWRTALQKKLCWTGWGGIRLKGDFYPIKSVNWRKTKRCRSPRMRGSKRTRHEGGEIPTRVRKRYNNTRSGKEGSLIGKRNRIMKNEEEGKNSSISVETAQKSLKRGER